MKGLCILGSTGSIGVSTLDVVARHPHLYKLIALTANKNSEALYQQCLKHKPEYAVLCDPQQAEQLEQKLHSSDAAEVKVLSGPRSLEIVAALPQVDAVMASIVGAAGLLPSLAAAQAGKQVLLANKEALVMSGQLFMQAVAEADAELLPIDSEHNAIFQCMPTGYHAGKRADSVAKILLTASGGPFRTLPLDQLESVTPEQAVAHPNWDMGQKISVDSATMMNKGLELIEACLLFNISPKEVQIVIHPQSIIHSMVAYVDGTVLAQMGNPDMRIPIAHALAWPERFESGAEPLDLFAVQRLDFEPPDLQRFPCLALAFDAITAGGAMPTILNAANEIAVDAFLSKHIRFTDIAKVIETCMQQCSQNSADTLDLVLESDKQSREVAQHYINSI